MSSTAGLVEINISNPAASTLILPSLSSNYVGMTIFPGECNSFLGGDFQGQLFLLNLETGNETPLCTLPNTAGGLTTLAEFNSADPCNIEIDLDGDNSSGGVDFDYQSQIATCNTPAVFIADIDMTITSPEPINSLTVSIISGIQNIGGEVLELTSLPAGLTITGSGTTTLTIENTSGNASVSDFITAVQNILYQNNAILPIAGERIISVVFYASGGSISNIANAYVEVVELPVLTVNLGNDSTYCSGYTVYLDAGYPGSNYVWNTGETNAGILVSTSDEYSVTVSNAFACSGADSVNINFIPAYTSFEELILCQGDSVFLENEWQTTAGIYIDQYVSVNQCDSIITTSLTILETDTVQLTSFTCDNLSAGVFSTLLTGSNGCDSLVISNIYLLPQDSCETIIPQEDFPLEIFAPNIFSPDFNGINDVFMLYSNDPTAVISKLRIFDRWGELIYQVNDCHVNTSACGWDGNFRFKPLDSDVFVFWAEIKRSNGEIKIVNGDFTLIR
jgi:gliding motility-associated-like protein